MRKDDEPADADPTNARRPAGFGMNVRAPPPRARRPGPGGAVPGGVNLVLGGHVIWSHLPRNVVFGAERTKVRIVTPHGLYQHTFVPTRALSSPFVCNGNVVLPHGVISVLVISVVSICASRDSWRVTGGARSL